MTIDVYGKKDCGLCKSAKKKINVLLDRWEMDEEVEINFLDMEGDEKAAAEGDFFDVFEIPTVMVMADRWNVLGRWDGQAPASDELKDVLEGEEEQESVAA